MFDCVVIGLGGVGSFALRSVARDMKKMKKTAATTTASDSEAAGTSDRRSAKILGLERHEVGHSRGSSHGKSRVYRKAYFEHPSYVPWCQYSEDEFRALEKSANVRLLERCGVLVVAPARRRSLLDACVGAANQHNIPIEELATAAELRSRFPQYRYIGAGEDDDDMAGVYEPGGGMVRPERAANAALREAQEVDGVDVLVWDHCRVLSMEEKNVKKTGSGALHDGDGGGDSTSDDTYVELVLLRKEKKNSKRHPGTPYTSESNAIVEARKVVVAAGAWTSDILPSWGPHLKPIRILQSWVDISNAAAGGGTSSTGNSKDGPLSLYGVSRMPCAVMVNPDELPVPVYCLPADPDADEADDESDRPDKYRTCIKLGIHGDVGGRGRIDPDENYRTEVTAEEQRHVDSAIRSALHADVSSQLPCVETRPCMYTMTEDENFMVGVPDGYTKVCAVAGLSGHGFKMAPALGQMLADFATGKGLDRWNAGFCSPKRFGV